MLGLSVEELAGLTPFDFEIKCAGYRHSKKIEESLVRKMTWLNVAMNIANGNPTDIMNKYFPSIYDDGEVEKPLFSKKQISATIKRYQEMKQLRLNKVVN